MAAPMPSTMTGPDLGELQCHRGEVRDHRLPDRLADALHHVADVVHRLLVGLRRGQALLRDREVQRLVLLSGLFELLVRELLQLVDVLDAAAEQLHRRLRLVDAGLVLG
jgi:hypothetical protein